MATEGGVQHEGVPRLVPGWEEKAADLRPEEGFLLSRIDGQTSWAMLRTISLVSTPPTDTPMNTSAPAITSPRVRASVSCANRSR